MHTRDDHILNLENVGKGKEQKRKSNSLQIKEKQMGLSLYAFSRIKASSESVKQNLLFWSKKITLTPNKESKRTIQLNFVCKKRKLFQNESSRIEASPKK